MKFTLFANREHDLDMDIKYQYVLDDQNRKVAIQLDLDTFRKIEEALEYHALYHLMKDEEDPTILTLEEVRAFYQQLDKA